MASSTILSPRPLDLAPAASLSELDQFCSGPLDSFLEEATRYIKRSPVQHRSGNPSSKATSNHKRSASGSGKSNKAGAVKKAQVCSSAYGFHCPLHSATCLCTEIIGKHIHMFVHVTMLGSWQSWFGIPAQL